jgi:hypothetical protein
VSNQGSSDRKRHWFLAERTVWYFAISLPKSLFENQSAHLSGVLGNKVVHNFFVGLAKLFGHAGVFLLQAFSFLFCRLQLIPHERNPVCEKFNPFPLDGGGRQLHE